MTGWVGREEGSGFDVEDSVVAVANTVEGFQPQTFQT